MAKPYIDENWPELLTEMADAHREQDALTELAAVRIYSDVTDGGSRGCTFEELFELLYRPEIRESQIAKLLTIEHIGLRLKHEGEIEAATACISFCENGYQLIGRNAEAANMSDVMTRILMNQGRLAEALDECKKGDELLGIAEVTTDEGSTEEARIELAKDPHRALRYQVHSAVRFA